MRAQKFRQSMVDSKARGAVETVRGTGIDGKVLQLV
jgi:hypothetical protein